ncbi:MAG: hypothetical protein WDZ59_08010 [Pirellulales bacterium]
MADLLTRCSVCEGLIDEEDLFCANCGTEAPQSERSAPQASHVTQHNFQCSGCGASMSYDASAQALRCPFCGSEHLTQQKDARVLAPRRVVLFRLRRDEATVVMRKWLGRGFWRPGDLSEKAMIVQMAAVYVPYWVFEATTHTYWTADTNQLEMFARGDWRPLFGEHRGRHENLLVGASSVLTSSETSQLCPFKLEEAVPPDQVDLENLTVEQFSVSRKYARPLAREGLERLEAQTCELTYVPGRARNVHVNTLLEGLTSEPVLLPVWVMAYRYHDKLYRFLVNGQNGKASGLAPTSLAKIALGVVVFAIIALIMLGFAALAAGETVSRPQRSAPPTAQVAASSAEVCNSCQHPIGVPVAAAGRFGISNSRSECRKRGLTRCKARAFALGTALRHRVCPLFRPAHMRDLPSRKPWKWDRHFIAVSGNNKLPSSRAITSQSHFLQC